MPVRIISQEDLEDPKLKEKLVAVYSEKLSLDAEIQKQSPKRLAEKTLARELQKHFYFYAETPEGKPVGLIRFSTGSKVVMVRECYIREKFRKKGYATLLTDLLVHRARSAGYQRVDLRGMAPQIKKALELFNQYIL